MRNSVNAFHSAHFDLGGYVNKQNFGSRELKRRLLATFGFNRTPLRATQRKLYSIISRRADVVWPLRSCDFTPLEYYLWGAVKVKCYADKPVTFDAFKENVRETIGEIQLHTIDNVFKN